MRPLRAWTLVLVAVVVAVVAWAVGGALDSRGTDLPLPWTSPAVVLVLAAAVLAVGLPVRRWSRGQRGQRFDPLRAARAGVLGQAASVTGAGLAGLYAGLSLVLAPTAGIEARRGDLVRALVALLASLVLLVVGILVQRWCRLPPDDDDLARERRRREQDAERAERDHDGSHSHQQPPGSRGHRGSR